MNIQADIQHFMNNPAFLLSVGYAVKTINVPRGATIAAGFKNDIVRRGAAYNADIVECQFLATQLFIQPACRAPQTCCPGFMIGAIV